MDAETIAGQLEGRKEGSGWRCRCPVHGGHSLKVTQRDDRPVLWCFGGCDFAEVVRELRSMGLWPESTEEAKREAKERRQARDVERAIQIIHIAHEATGEIPNRFGRDYRWARKVLANAGYTLRYVPSSERRWPEQRVEVVAKNP